MIKDPEIVKKRTIFKNKNEITPVLIARRKEYKNILFLTRLQSNYVTMWAQSHPDQTIPISGY